MKYLEEDKYEMVLQLLKDTNKAEFIANKYKIAVSTLYKWRSRFLDGARQELANYKTGPKQQKIISEKEIKLSKKVIDYERKIAELSVENEILKKKENWTEGPLL